MIRKVERLREVCDEARAAGDIVAFGEKARPAGEPVGFVPTMGALHEGHLSLVRRAREECSFVVLSVFVNRLQFGPEEDFETYPRDPAADAELAEKEGVDVLFAPDDGVMFPRSEPAAVVDPGPLGDVLEGAARPGHFRGVCTVVAKLFNMAGPCHAYFGEKDYQQLVLVRNMVADLDFPVEVVGCPIVREPDGLAMSSRNAYLSKEERSAATCLHRALLRASEVVAHGESDANIVRAEMAKVIGAEPLARIEYVTVVAEGTVREIATIESAGEWRVTVQPGGLEEPIPLPHARALVAARIGSTRLIDNMPVAVRENR